MIQTRWGRMTVSENLDTILNLANADRGGFKAPQLDSFTRINEESLSL
jgi:flagellar basal body rod protein FlgG